MKRTSLIIVALILILTSTSWCFDGRREGFVLGGGLGFGPIAKVSLANGGGSSYTESGLALNFLIGYAWDHANMLVFLRDGVMYSRRSIFGDNIDMAQGFTGMGYYHYFGRTGNSGFFTAGLGFQDWTSLDSRYKSNDIGIGLLLGGGYEFARHFQAYINLSFGRTSYSLADYDHSQLTVGVATVAF